MPQTIECPLSIAARRQPDHPAIIGDQKLLSYTELNHWVDALSIKMSQQHWPAEARIAIVANNSIEHVVTLLAIWRSGLVACPISPRFPKTKIFELMKNLNTSVLLTNFKEFLEVSPPDIQIMNLIEWTDCPNIDHQGNQQKFISLNQPASIIWTSGSQGAPKAVLHTYGNHYLNALASNDHIPLTIMNRWLLSLPLYHVGGGGIIFRSLLAGSSMVIANAHQDVTSLVEKYKVTHISLVPTQLYRILKIPQKISRCRTLQSILLGGSAVSDHLLEKAAKHRLPIYLTYGLTEMASQVATSSNALTRSVKPLKYSELKISQDGEILLKGKTLFLGYVDEDGIELSKDEDGWFKTGDIGTLDAEKNLIVTGRKDNMFISGGENIQPEEIEGYLQKIHGVGSAFVVPVSDTEFGHRPVAFIQMKDEGISISVIIQFLEQNLPRFKIPIRFYHWVEEPANDSFKPSRRFFRQLIQEESKQLRQIL